MGGNVFPDKSRRYERNEYLKIETKLIKDIFPRLFSRFNVCPYLQDKSTFGDMDVLCIGSDEMSKDLLKTVFNTECVSHNGNCWSVLFEELQIDLIMTNEEEWDFHKNYLGVYDRGNFVGKVAHMLGLKFGHDGLWLPVRASNDHKLGDILLTLDPRVAEDFLDIKPLVNAQSFQDVFDNIVASKYFNPEVFLLENNNSIARIRDRKRPSYHQFLDLCSQLPQREWFPRSEDKTQYLQMIFAAFPYAFKEYKILWARKELADEVRKKFNGDLVSKWTNLQGKELGLLISEFKKYYRDSDLINMDNDTIRRCVQIFNNFFMENVNVRESEIVLSNCS